MRISRDIPLHYLLYNQAYMYNYILRPDPYILWCQRDRYFLDSELKRIRRYLWKFNTLNTKSSFFLSSEMQTLANQCRIIGISSHASTLISSTIRQCITIRRNNCTNFTTLTCPASISTWSDEKRNLSHKKILVNPLLRSQKFIFWLHRGPA